MTIFLNTGDRQQPAFIYATYAAGVTVTDSPDSANYDPANVLQPDEVSGWKPANLTGSHSLIFNLQTPVPLEHVAICGKALNGVTLEIRGSSDNFATSDVQVLAATVLSGERAARCSFTQATYQYFKFSFSGHGSTFMVKHIADRLALLPFINDGFCEFPLESDGDHLISHEGLFLGSVTSKVMRSFSLDFGQLTFAELPTFDAWANSCIKTAQGFFFIPNTAEDTIYFGWVDKGYKYQPTQKTGLYSLGAIPFQARAI